MLIVASSMVVAGVFKKKRQYSCWANGGADGASLLSVMWLMLQMILMWTVEAFNAVGQFRS